MAKVKQTKTELKAQSDALKRFQRFLPMLQLKKQQLQAELAQIAAQVESVRTAEAKLRDELNGWIELFADNSAPLALLQVTCERINISSRNVAGVTMPVYQGIETTTPEFDLFATPPWFDDATTMITNIMACAAQRQVLERQAELIAAELNTTSQRVNLFEKVKIPECLENIRIIKIAIGDEQTASITRGKIAKSRAPKRDNAEDAA